MTEKQLIEKLNKLSEIKPSKQWVDLTKKSILGADFIGVSNDNKITIKARFTGFVNTISLFNYKTKFAYSLAGVLLLAGGIFAFSQNAVPGDMLFAVRSATDKIKTVFVGKQDSSNLNFEVANKRLDELVAMVKDNNNQDKTLAISQLKASITDAAKNLIVSAKKNPKSVKDIVAEANKIKESAVLLDIVGNSETQEISGGLYKVIVQEEIKALENSTLTEDQEKALEEIKILFDKGSYLEAFEQILVISN
jgi:hypothetical protein